MTATTEEQIAAWEDYRQAKAKAERTMKFEDGRAAALAWNAFANLFTGRQAPTDQVGKLIVFPVHKTRAPGAA